MLKAVMSTRVAAVAVTSLGLAFAITMGCGGGEGGTAKAKLPEGVRSQAIEHESCSESGHKVESVDVNNDGKPDIRRVYDGTREVCRISDLNHDGKPDMFEYYDTNGQLRRREADYDDNGIVNSIEIYENGKLVRAELDTTNQGRIDTWDTFDPGSGKRIKRERDSTGDGRVDQWWTYDGDKVTIAMDKNGDGLPDPDSQVTMGGSSGGPSTPNATDAGAAPAPAPPPEPAATTASKDLAPTTSDAGAPTPPKRGGAKR